MLKAITNYELRITNLKSKIVNLKYRSLLLLTVYCSLFTVFYGCASAKKSELPDVQIEAIEYNQRGVNAVLAGNYDRAVIEFKRSLKLNTSIDNQNGVCANLLNLGRVYLAADRFDDARPVLEKALQLGLNINDQLMISEAYACQVSLSDWKQ
ncbi:MAG: tetratricopeptide repeat protein [Deltaproteobacteria bacterium]|nr:tetratricopeptide repeat protein [Deltaproteobacteria bacterium]